jgi:hypothetical protein
MDLSMDRVAIDVRNRLRCMQVGGVPVVIMNKRQYPSMPTVD